MDGEKDIKAMTPPKKTTRSHECNFAHGFEGFINPPDLPPPARPTHER